MTAIRSGGPFACPSSRLDGRLRRRYASAAAHHADLPGRQAAESGVDTVYNGDWEFMVGGGVSTFDCDDDGFPDMLLRRGFGKSVFYHNESKKGGDDRLQGDDLGP